MKRYLYIFFLITALAFIFWYSAKVQESFYRVVALLEAHAALRPLTTIAIFVLFAAVSAMVSPFSSVPLVPPAILIWGSERTFLLLLIGWLFGGVFTYLAGCYGINPVLRRFIDIENKIEYYQSKISKRAELWLVMLFRLAMPAEIPGYVLGSIRYHFAWYFFATLVSEFMFALATVYGSAAILDKRLDILVALGIVLTTFFAGMFYLFSRELKRRKTEKLR